MICFGFKETKTYKIVVGILKFLRTYMPQLLENRGLYMVYVSVVLEPRQISLLKFQNCHSFFIILFYAEVYALVAREPRPIHAICLRCFRTEAYKFAKISKWSFF